MNGRDIFIIIIQVVLGYFLLSTILASSDFVGTFGENWGKGSRYYLGYLSFVFYVALIAVAVHLYKDRIITSRKVELFIASILLFFTLLIFQDLVVSNNWQGDFGHSFVAFIEPIIGLFGAWLFWLAMTLVSVMILTDKNITQLYAALKDYKNLKEHFKSSIDSTNQEIDEVLKSKIDEKSNNIEESNLKNEDNSQKEPAQNLDKHDENTIDQKVLSLNEKLQNILPEEDGITYEIKKVVHKEEKPKEQTLDQKEEKSPEDSLQTTTETATQPKEEKQEPLKHETTEDSEPKIDQEISQETKSSAIIVNELEENKKLLEGMEVGKVEKPKDFMLPPLEILQLPSRQTHQQNEGHLDVKIKNLMDKLHKFKIEGDVIRTYTGPVVSTFEFKPSAHIKVSKIITLQDDLAMALKAKTIRIQAPIPGKDVVGIEIPNEEIETIYLRDILESELFKSSKSPLTIALGQDIVGKPFVTDLKKLPHLLIAGTTGSGKSVGINAMILSLLYRNSPKQLRLMMIDPKMLEFSIYNDIPHLLTPVITQAKQAVVALSNMVSEMERRYKLMSESKTKNIDNYNEKVKKQGKEPLPYIVVVIDELADLMMTSGKDVEYSIGRLAQMARASGIHLIVATQRPSVDVVTGLIKANLPSRISYKVGQKVDSKVIIDAMGAESLLGRGDMLFTPPGTSGLVRLHAPWSSEEEIEEIVEFLKDQAVADYDQRFLQSSEGSGNGVDDIMVDGDLDPLYEDAKSIVISDNKTSISYLQRKLQIGYNRAANIIEQLEAMGVLSEPNAKGAREIL